MRKKDEKRCGGRVAFLALSMLLAFMGISCDTGTSDRSGQTKEEGSIDTDAPPLYFFYAIHTHVEGDYAPYKSFAMEEIDNNVAENMIAAIEGIADVLRGHGAKGTWEVVYGTSKGLCTYQKAQGEDPVFDQLLEAGDEVGVHAHHTDEIGSAYVNLRDECDILSNVTSGFMPDIVQADPQEVQETMSQAIETALSYGMTVGTENLSPGGSRNPFGDLCDDQIGVDNDMWSETGNLMFPWRPDYLNRNICADNPEGEMILLDHVSIEWTVRSGEGKIDVLKEEDFESLESMLDAALAYLEENRPEKIAVWGFVTHLTEYAVGDRGENPPEQEALDALDRFLEYVDTKVAEGRVIYATASEIAKLVATSP